MRTPILMLGLLAILVHGHGCEQVYVRVQNGVNVEYNLQLAYSNLIADINSQVQTTCLPSTDTAAFDGLNYCWYQPCADPPTIICGFRLWRVLKGSDCNLEMQLNSYFQTVNSGNPWIVIDKMPTGDVKCNG
jgi:hypothetical protein